MPSVQTERKIDIACLIVFPLICVFGFLLAANGYASNRNHEYAAAVQIACALTVIVLPLLRIKKMFFAPYWFIAIMTANIFMFSFMVLFGTYDDIWWWSPFTHWLSGMLVTMIVFMALLVIKNYTTRISLPNGVLLFITFMVGMAFGLLWEMWETLMDVIYGEPTMVYNTSGTIRDLYMDALGSLTMIIIGAILLRHRRPDQIIGRIGLDHKMKTIGEKWDRRCDGKPRAKRDLK